MKTDGGYDIALWYHAFADAVEKEAKAAKEKLAEMEFSRQGVPVTLPVVSPFLTEQPYIGTCESLIQELMLHIILSQTAKDPMNPNTNEIANAETLVGSIALQLAGFPLDMPKRSGTL